MARAEITIPVDLSDEQEARCVMHSFCNVLNILMGEMQVLRKIIDKPNAFETSLDLCDTMLASFTNQATAVESVAALEGQAGSILGDIEAVMRNSTVPEEHQMMAKASIASLKAIMDVVDVRVKEILARQQAPGSWQDVSVTEIQNNLRQVFEAIALNSRGRYGIVFSEREQGDNDYLMRIRLQTGNKDTISIPPVLADVMRDLAANARKYSTPGSRIDTDLIDDGTEILLRVADEGRGIPEDQLIDVVRFGVRGSNTTPEETKGGGFGLTKAYYVCKQYGGRMWIESVLERGTLIEIRIPRR